MTNLNDLSYEELVDTLKELLDKLPTEVLDKSKELLIESITTIQNTYNIFLLSKNVEILTSTTYPDPTPLDKELVSVLEEYIESQECFLVEKYVGCLWKCNFDTQGRMISLNSGEICYLRCKDQTFLCERDSLQFVRPSYIVSNTYDVICIFDCYTSDTNIVIEGIWADEIYPGYKLSNNESPFRLKNSLK